MKMRSLICLFLLLPVLSAAAQTAPEGSPAPASDGPVQLEVFKGPITKQVQPPTYPISELLKGYEGWVNLNFMIDPQGKPYEIVVTDSSGNEAFEQAALVGAQKWTFEPASIGGMPIHAGHNMKVRFAQGASPASGASRPFVKTYRKMMQAIAANDRPGADAELAKLEAQNLYEDAYLHLGKYNYYHAWGNEIQQLQELRGAIAHEDVAQYLPKAMFAAALQSLFPLQVKAKDFAGAMQTWHRLQKSSADKEALANWKKTVAMMETLRQDDHSYSVLGEIQSGTSWFFRLFKGRFKIIVRNGHLSEVKLRCDKKYVFFRYEADLQYSIGKKLSNCDMELVGEPGTRFDVIQS